MFILGELPQVHAELACVLNRGVKEGFVLHSQVECFELVLEIHANSFYCLVGGRLCGLTQHSNMVQGCVFMTLGDQCQD